MKKSHMRQIINTTVGMFLLIYGVWMISTGIESLLGSFEKARISGLERDGLSPLLWYTLIIDSAMSCVLGVLSIFMFIHRLTGRFVCGVIVIRYLKVILTDICYWKELGFTMTSLNNKRLIFSLVLTLIGFWYYWQRRNGRMPKWFPYIAELKGFFKKMMSIDKL